MKGMVFEIADRCENRYPTEGERRRLTNYAESLPARLELIQALEAGEKGIAKKAMLAMRERHPELADEHDDQWAKTFRDHQMTLRAVAQAYLLGEVGYLEERLLYWFRTILASFGYTGEEMAFAFGALAEGAKAELGDERYAELEPYFQRTVDVMGDIMAPAASTAPAGD